MGRGREREGRARVCGIYSGTHERSPLIGCQGSQFQAMNLWAAGSALPPGRGEWSEASGVSARRQVRLVATLGMQDVSGCVSPELAAWQPRALPKSLQVSVRTGARSPLAAVTYRSGSVPQWSRELYHLEFLGSTFLHWSLSHSRIRLCYWPLAPASFCRRSEGRQQK